VAGNRYHEVITAHLADHIVSDGDAFVVMGDRHDHQGNFDDVIFIIDEENKPLSELVLIGLQTARTAGFRYVSFPVMRTGKGLGRIEINTDQVISQMQKGLEEFIKESPETKMNITVVVYNDKETLNKFCGFMQLVA
jgi:hypothetical protein